MLDRRRAEADEFHAAVLPEGVDEQDALIARRAFAGLMWGKQLYRWSVHEWLEEDPAQPAPPPQRRAPGARNVDWSNLDLADVISMPDDWEYPWFASWDLGLHCLALAHVDPWFAKQQLLLMMREWSQHPDGKLPAYEWSFDDVNPPVLAWAAWMVYLIDGRRDRSFLEQIVTKSVMNFTWWVNRKDANGSGLFEGGFLGMDNISLFDRSGQVPPGWELEQSDGTNIAPGAVDTPINTETLADQEKVDRLNETIPLGRVATPEEIAATAVFAMSDGARYMSGTGQCSPSVFC